MFQNSGIKYLLLIVVVGSLLPHRSDAQFRQFETDSKPSNKWIRCIHQDQDGFIWFGTMQGLNRFDGINYRTFLPKSEEGDSIDTTIVNFLQSNGDVSYWIGTNIGLYAFDRKTGEFEMHPFAQDIAVNDLLTVGDSLWLATLDGIRIIRDDSSFSIKVEEILKEEQHWQSNLIHTFHLV